MELAVTGKLIAKRYRLEHQVGEGGMATVWVAEDEKLERWVALKLLGKNFLSSRSVRQRFEREAMAIAKLRSPHVVQVFDHGTDIDEAGVEVAYIAMELLSGQDLYTWLKNNRPVPLAQIAKIVDQVARALAVAHRAGIVHRDLKPANIFVVRDHEDETVKVFDFGLARGFRDDSQLRELRDRTGEGVLLGTPRYMSPEQAHGARRVDHRGDLWSLAVIAYLAVTGRLPFDGTGVGEVVTKIATEEVKPPSRFVAGIGPELDAFFVKALAKDPDARFQSAGELAEAFEGAIGSARTPRDLIPMIDGDTEIEVTRAQPDAHGPPDPTLEDGEPSSSDAPTLLQPPRPALSKSWASRRSLVAGLMVAATVAVLAASYKFERRLTQTTPALRVPLLETRRAVDRPSSPAVLAPLSAPSVSSAPVPVRAAPMASSAAPTASVSERGLELFDDRH